jgi:hypothetical protein
MALNGCCVIPCIQELILWLIEIALIKQTPMLYKFLLSTPEIETQILLNEFEKKKKKKDNKELWGKQSFLAKSATLFAACNSGFLFTELNFHAEIATYPTPRFQV